MFYSNYTIPSLEQIFYPRNVESRKMVKRYKRFGNPDISQPWHTTLPLGESRTYSTQDMRCSSIASETVRLTSIPLYHFSPSTRLQHAYESRYELPLQLRLRFRLPLDLFLRVLSHQNPGSAALLLPFVVYPG